ncbi:hypothetical protein SAMN05216238_1062 [Lentibacillus persicus]|uniref:Uncharacterized protein n=1 Tax=Lentibacillus persicus TaxID=640948 RepID=A0A1I1WIA3_9BACI|nr:hypothetical protein [Lentibacillus persicus]SFD93163.1 hypothetical protein SAMN05216238_1062 [Lentibacillus persicus]
MRCMAIIVIIIGLVAPLEAYAEVTATSQKQLSEFNIDLTGNSSNEKVKLNGVPFAPDSNYYTEINTIISDSKDKQWDITYEGGYNPAIKFYDLDHDGVKDIFYQSDAGGNKGLYHYHLHTFKKDQLKEIALPEQQSIQAKFVNGFKIEIQIDYEAEPITAKLNNRSSKYIKLGIYNEEGKLLDSTTPLVEPISFFEPVEVEGREGYGLKSYQHISGAYHADLIGTVETVWYYDRDKWIILETEWLPS